MPKKKNVLVVISILLLCIISAVFIITNTSKHKKIKQKQQTVSPEIQSEPKFRKDGQLMFYSGSTLLKTISIEISDDEAEREQGLMYRKTMPDSCGMLFIFEFMQPLSFWMKNTFIPLDLIFLDDNYTIVNISKNATPLSEEAIPSVKEAMYVIEVNAGFCEKNNISEGKKIRYTLK